MFRNEDGFAKYALRQAQGDGRNLGMGEVATDSQIGILENRNCKKMRCKRISQAPSLQTRASIASWVAVVLPYSRWRYVRETPDRDVRSFFVFMV